MVMGLWGRALVGCSNMTRPRCCQVLRVPDFRALSSQQSNRLSDPSLHSMMPVLAMTSSLFRMGSGLEGVATTSQFLHGNPNSLDLLNLGLPMGQNLGIIRDPSVIQDRYRQPPSVSRDVIVEDPRLVPEVRDPVHPGLEDLVKEAHRMLRIRKKKMKVHRRRRLWKRMWSIWKKKFARREREREVIFRKRLIAKVQAAQVFDARTFVDDYLEDHRFQFTPKTYKGRRKPQWLIRELLERDRDAETRKVMDRTNLLTNKPLVLPGETVQQFIERNWKN